MDTDQALAGRVALVTGGDRGIGAAIALALAKAGADVALGRRAACVQADLGQVDEAVGMAEDAVRALGEVDVLVCNAGIGRAVELDELDLALFEQTLAVNLRAPFLLTQALLPAMRRRRWGRLLYVSSTAAQVGGIVGPHYAASKAGLVGLAHGYASRVAREGITANVLAPALVETEMIASNPRARADRVP